VNAGYFIFYQKIAKANRARGSVRNRFAYDFSETCCPNTTRLDGMLSETRRRGRGHSIPLCELRQRVELAAGGEDAVHVALAPLCAIGNQWWLDATACDEAE
jgi:hypothetical protein